MKRLLSLLLSLLMLLTLFGCSNSGNTGGNGGSAAGDKAGAPGQEFPEREQLTFWFWGAATNYQEHMKKVLCDWYNNSQDKYELSLEFRATVDADIPVALAAGQGPDIMYVSGPSYTATFAQEGLVLDLTPYSEQYGWNDRLLDIAYQACTLDGKLYCLPGGLLVGGLYYNKDVFAEEGWNVPTTMDELISTMDAAKEKGYYPLAAGNKGWKPCNDNFSSMIIGSYLPGSYIYNALTG